MAKKEVSLFDGKLIVVVQKGYSVYEKDIPEAAKAEPEINWIGNFGILEVDTGKKLNGKVPKYTILSPQPDEENKTMWFWDVSEDTPIKKEVPGQKKVKKNNKQYGMGELELGDPAIGWG